MKLRLVDIEGPLDDVEFPNGATHVPVPFGPTEYRLWRDIQEERDAGERGRMLMAIVTACYPTATADDIDSCTPKMLIAMAAHAGRKIEQIRAALKNVDAAATPTENPPPLSTPSPSTAPSSPKTSGATSSRKRRKRAALIGGTPTGPAPTASPT